MNYTYEYCTRSMNYLLYKAAMSCCDEQVQHRRLLFTTADGYLYSCLQTKADFVVNIDEDAFLLNKDALHSLMDYMNENDIAVCGMPDGGVACRDHNPFVINPFFSVFNVRQLKRNVNKYQQGGVKMAVNMFNYELHKAQMEASFPWSLVDRSHADINDDDFEPYYDFFLWLCGTQRTLYLQAETWREDGLSTLLYNQDTQPLVLHTWYSRAYNKDPYHTERINRVIAYAREMQRLPEYKPTPYVLRRYAVERTIISRMYDCMGFVEHVKRYVRKRLMRLFHHAR